MRSGTARLLRLDAGWERCWRLALAPFSRIAAPRRFGASVPLPAAVSTSWCPAVVGETGREIAVHVTRELDRDRTERAGIPITSIARTLLDLAEVVPERQIARAFEQAERLQLLDLNAVEEVCRRCLGRRGLGALMRVVAEQGGPPPATRSELERAFLDFCAHHQLPKPLVNAIVCGLEVDAVWKQQRVIVELDSFAFHRARAAFERDRARDVELQNAGFRVLRLTDRRLRRDPCAVAEALRAILQKQAAGLPGTRRGGV